MAAATHTRLKQAPSERDQKLGASARNLSLGWRPSSIGPPPPGLGGSRQIPPIGRILRIALSGHGNGLLILRLCGPPRCARAIIAVRRSWSKPCLQHNIARAPGCRPGFQGESRSHSLRAFSTSWQGPGQRLEREIGSSRIPGAQPVHRQLRLLSRRVSATARAGENTEGVDIVIIVGVGAAR